MRTSGRRLGHLIQAKALHPNLTALLMAGAGLYLSGLVEGILAQGNRRWMFAYRTSLVVSACAYAKVMHHFVLLPSLRCCSCFYAGPAGNFGNFRPATSASATTIGSVGAVAGDPGGWLGHFDLHRLSHVSCRAQMCFVVIVSCCMFVSIWAFVWPPRV